MRLRWSVFHARYRCQVPGCDRWAVLGSPTCTRHDNEWIHWVLRQMPEWRNR